MSFLISTTIKNEKITLRIKHPENTTINKLIQKINKRITLKKEKIRLLKDTNEGILFWNDKVSCVLCNRAEVICIRYDENSMKKKLNLLKFPNLVEEQTYFDDQTYKKTQKSQESLQTSMDQIIEKHLQSAPQWMFCPFTKKIFHDPFCLPCGHNFEKSEIDNYLKSNRVCPICKKNINKNPYMNLNLKQICLDWKKKVIRDIQKYDGAYQRLKRQKQNDRVGTNNKNDGLPIQDTTSMKK
ncbi:ring-type e3 ubiquitin transferase [Anaeramoeba flamelloides]|uniref:Ring-type e3 ubiquitin transferase n=1 Tax=Anaeramoeba flamelloides TaxID=1746091 RepID=A0ABQ8XTU6_9EUKA|nr:ring-type e3 ubiquitin transferase [Anaeramoeba flamelloides]